MNNFKVFSKEDIQSVIDMDKVITAVEKAYAYKCDNKAELFPIVTHSFEDGVSEFDIKSGSVDGAGIFGMKVVSAFEGNDKYNLPRLTGTILIFDRETGMLKSMMDGGLITNMRTGAAGAVGCKYLARPESETLLLVGTGAQGPVLLDATLRVMKNIKRILICNPRSPKKVDDFIACVRENLKITIPMEAVTDLEAAAGISDIILTAVPSRQAVIKADWIRPGTHLSCIGSDMEGKQELEEKLLARSKVYCDDLKQVIAVGECEKAVKQGILNPEEITEIGDVILGKASARESDDDITIFDSTGIALQDLMTASDITDSISENKYEEKRNLLLEEMTWVEIDNAIRKGFDTVIIFAASIEQHGPALPESTDMLLGYAEAVDLAKRLGNALVAPVIRPGLSAHHMCFPGSITLRPETFKAIVEDYISAYVHHGFKNIILCSSHGGNFKMLEEIAQLQAALYPENRIVTGLSLEELDASLIEMDKMENQTIGTCGGHACQWETSMIMMLDEGYVRKDKLQCGHVGELTAELLDRFFNNGVKSVSPIGVMGDPTASTSEKGRRFFNILQGLQVQAIQEKLKKD